MAAAKPISSLSTKVYQKRRRFCSTRVEWKVVPSERKLVSESQKGVKSLKKPRVFTLELQTNDNLLEDQRGMKKIEQEFLPVDLTRLVPPYPPPPVPPPPAHFSPGIPPPSVHGTCSTTGYQALPPVPSSDGHVLTPGAHESRFSTTASACCVCTRHQCPPPFHHGYPQLERTHLCFPSQPTYHRQHPVQPHGNSSNLLFGESPILNGSTEQAVPDQKEESSARADQLNQFQNTKSFHANTHVISEGTILQIIHYGPNGQILNTVPSVGLVYHRVQPPPQQSDSPPCDSKLQDAKKNESHVEGVEPTNK